MADEDITFPAEVSITSTADPLGVKVAEVELNVDPSVLDTPLPPGPQGDAGPRGIPRATWVKQGEIPNAAARPTGLTADDAGKWWHRLDTNGMDTWNGEEWVHSPNAVGVQGPPGPNNILLPAPVRRDPTFTHAGLKISGYGAQQELEVTVPAGPKGLRGDPGDSGVLREAPDFDQRFGPVDNGLFAWNRGPRKFRPMPPPNGVGPWGIGQESFKETGTYGTLETTLAQIDIPALPFKWRPFCYGSLILQKATSNAWPHVWVRLNSPGGNPVAHGVLPFRVTNIFFFQKIGPYFGEQRVSPTSNYGVVEAYEPATLFVINEIQGNTSGTVGHHQSGAHICVYAMPA